MKSVLFVMSLSGTTMLILQIIINSTLKNIISANIRYLLLKLSIIFYLLPLPLIKNHYMKLLGDFGDSIFALPKEKIYKVDIVEAVGTEDFYVFPTFRLFIMLVVIVYFIIILLIIRQIVLYFILRLKIAKYSEKVYDKDIISILDEEKEALKLKRKIIIRISDYIETPMTTGFFNPIILIPKIEITKEKLKWILRHELTHIYNYDYIYNVLCIIVKALHWFNPFVYLLFKQVSIFSEFNCDENIVKNLSMKERIEYGNIILEFSVKTNKKMQYKSISLLGSCDKKIMKERLIIVKRLNKRKKFKNIIQAITIMSTVLINSLTVFAYKKPVLLNESADSFNYSTYVVDAYFTPNLENKLPDFDGTEIITYYFIDEKNVYKVDENNEKASCNHNYTNGSYAKHILNGKGGCTIEYYNAKRCTECGYVVLRTKYDTETYEKCPH